MKENDEILKDYVSSGMDPHGLTDTQTELEKFLYDGDGMEYYHDTEWIDFADYPGKKFPDPAERSRRIKLHEPEDCRNRTQTGKEAAIFYAMRDSINMSTQEFAEIYNPTSLPLMPAGLKGSILFCLDEGAHTQLGNTDLDTALLLVAGHRYVKSETNLYGLEKRVWNLIKGEHPNFNFNNPAEQNSQIMADLMNNGSMKFHDFFPQYLHRVNDPNDLVNLSPEMKVLLEVHGNNLL